MNNHSINIVCATDDRYASYCGVMLTSVYENNKGRTVRVFILIDKPLLSENRRLLTRMAESYGQCIEYCVVDDAFLSNFPLKGDGVDYWSVVTYYRLYAAELLPEDVDIALYLDCDTIVDDSLGPLFDMDWSGYAVGVVADMCTEWKEFYGRLGYDSALGYFNAGVVLMNLDYWRKNDVGMECLNYLANNYDRILNNDQDVLNYVLRERKLNLPVKFNFQIQLLMSYFFDTFSDEMKRDVMKTHHPVVIHYAAELKPWMVRYYAYPFNDTWHKYKKVSLWKCMRDSYPPTRKWATFIKRYFLWPLGIKLKKPSFLE